MSAGQHHFQLGRYLDVIDDAGRRGNRPAVLAHPGDEILPAAQQVAGLAHAGGVDVGLGQRAAAEQSGDLAGVDLVVRMLVSGPSRPG